MTPGDRITYLGFERKDLDDVKTGDEKDGGEK